MCLRESMQMWGRHKVLGTVFELPREDRPQCVPCY